METKYQQDAYSSPWTLKQRAGFLLWRIACTLLFRPTPKFMNSWRIAVLRAFGCRVEGRPFVSASAKIRIPWMLSLKDRSCLGEDVTVYNLTLVEIGERATVAQEVYLCGGTHDLRSRKLPLVVGEIHLGSDVFIGARAFIMPGVRIGSEAAVGACAVVTKDVEESSVVAGNPARMIGRRMLDDGK